MKRTLGLFFLFLLILILSSGCLSMTSPNVTATVIGHSYNVDILSKAAQIKTTVEAKNNGTGMANNCDVSVLVKTKAGKLLGSNVVQMGNIAPGGTKVKDVIIPLSIGNIGDIVLETGNQNDLVYDTTVNCY